ALEVSFNDQLAKPSEVRAHFDGNDNATVELVFPAPPFSRLVIRSKWLALFQPGHRQFLSLQDPRGEVLAERLLSANMDTVTVHLDSVQTHPAPRASSGAFADFLIMGVRHIWTGYDHLLFLFGLLIVTRNFNSSIKIITCFT